MPSYTARGREVPSLFTLGRRGFSTRCLTQMALLIATAPVENKCISDGGVRHECSFAPRVQHWWSTGAKLVQHSYSECKTLLEFDPWNYSIGKLLLLPRVIGTFPIEREGMKQGFILSFKFCGE